MTPRFDMKTRKQITDLLYSVVNTSAFRALEHYGANQNIKADLHFSPDFGDWRTRRVDDAYIQLCKLVGYEPPARKKGKKKNEVH